MAKLLIPVRSLEAGVLRSLNFPIAVNSIVILDTNNRTNKQTNKQTNTTNKQTKQTNKNTPPPHTHTHTTHNNKPHSQQSE